MRTFAMGIMWFTLTVAAIMAVLIACFLRPLAWALGRMCPPLQRWARERYQKPPPEYIVEVLIPAMGGDEEYWFQLGKPRPSLDQAKAALEACRNIKSYGKRQMRIRSNEFPLIVVNPGDAPLVELHR